MQLAIPWPEVTHIAITHFHVDHWGELAHFLFALRWGVEPARSDPLTIFGPRGIDARLTTMAATFGDWVREPGYPLTVTTVEPGDVVQVSDGVQMEAAKTPHTDESLAFAIRSGKKRLVYTGDTGPSDELAAWAADCDLLLCECSLPRERAIPMHLTPEQAGALAARARAKRLVLTHFYPPLEGTSPEVTAAQHYAGPVVAARDGDTFIA
jgi:ribonuclease BN (tRNA processing enzyme)